MYCERCMTLFDTPATACPTCGGKKLREAHVGDFCFLAEKNALWGPILADVLRQSGIRFRQRSMLGAGLTSTIGVGMEQFRFYVPYEQIGDAREVLDSLFAPPDTDE